MPEFELRSFERPSDYEQCVALQMATWGDDFRELVPPAVIEISQKVGGVAAGAFDGERLLAFVWGLSGLRAGRTAHWSHMLAVDRQARGLGLGKHLKWFQRRLLLELGIEVMYWTFDPLVARNANLNINRLGALPLRFTRDMYGTETGSDLHSGLGTDRFVARWWLSSAWTEKKARDPSPLGVERRGESASGTALEAPHDAASSPMPIFNATEDGKPLPEPKADPSSIAPRLLVEVPESIERLKREDPELALAWRDAARASFESLLGAGYRVTAFHRRPAAHHRAAEQAEQGSFALRCFYELRGPTEPLVEAERS